MACRSNGKYFGTLRRRNNEASELRAGPAGKLPLQWFLFTKAHFSLCYSPQTNAKPLGGTDALPIICIHLGDGRPNKSQHSFKLLPVESEINLKAILVQAELLTQPVVFPVLTPATINAVDPHSPLATTTGAGGSSATSAATARSAINLAFIF